MSWAIGYDTTWRRDIGYGVPAICDQPGCAASIDRGLAYVCGSEPYGGEFGCGLYFCANHRQWFDTGGDRLIMICERCAADEDPFDPTPDVQEWIDWKLTDESWGEWRDAHPELVLAMKGQSDGTT